MSEKKTINGLIVKKDDLTICLKENISWVKNSFKVNNNYGSSRNTNMFGHWSKPYPETTGYLLTTLIKASEILEEPSLLELANRQVDFFKEIQLEKGGFKISLKEDKSYVFDTAQILLGLCTLYEKTKNNNALNIAYNAYHYLENNLDNDGLFINDNYVKNYNPAYYSRIAWPMIHFEKISGIDHNLSLQILNRVIKLKNKNHSFKNLSFHNIPYSLTHNLVYAYRGLLESAMLLNNESLKKEIATSITSILEKTVKKDKTFWGEYDEEWNANKSFICATGNAQMVVLVFQLIKNTNDNNILDLIPFLINPLIKSQSRSFIFNKGAIPSSIPLWGKYQRFKYTNWTQKFYSDALMAIISYCQE